jgi:hypothetical protein
MSLFVLNKIGREEKEKESEEEKEKQLPTSVIMIHCDAI